MDGCTIVEVTSDPVGHADGAGASGSASLDIVGHADYAHADSTSPDTVGHADCAPDLTTRGPTVGGIIPGKPYVAPAPGILI